MKKAMLHVLPFLPILVMLVGIGMNATVTAVNEGFMPVRVPGGCPGDLDWNHICMTSHTHLNFLADWITSNGGVSSPGDLVQDVAPNLTTPSLLVWAVGVISRLFRKQQ